MILSETKNNIRKGRDERYYRDCDSEQQHVHYLDNKQKSAQRQDILSRDECKNKYDDLMPVGDWPTRYPANTHFVEPTSEHC